MIAVFFKPSCSIFRVEIDKSTWITSLIFLFSFSLGCLSWDKMISNSRISTLADWIWVILQLLSHYCTLKCCSIISRVRTGCSTAMRTSISLERRAKSIEYEPKRIIYQGVFGYISFKHCSIVYRHILRYLSIAWDEIVSCWWKAKTYSLIFYVDNWCFFDSGGCLWSERGILGVICSLSTLFIFYRVSLCFDFFVFGDFLGVLDWVNLGSNRSEGCSIFYSTFGPSFKTSSSANDSLLLDY